MDKKSPSRMSESQYDKQIALVLQGGGALGSYQAGVYEAMAEYGYQPQWVAGISIGAINSAIIAGNAPEIASQDFGNSGTRFRLPRRAGPICRTTVGGTRCAG
jgi:predicted acylesterase/phospholipase RssA